MAGFIQIGLIISAKTVAESTLEKKIDEAVYQLYDLTDEEIAIVEGKV